jgi:hypothetical protein
VLLGQHGHPGDQLRLEVRRDGGVTVRRAMLPDQPARPPFADLELLLQMNNSVPAASRGQ